MNKPISTKVHGILDYVTAPTLFALPRVFKCGKKVTALLTGAALGALGYSVLTRYELGLVRVLPMPAHLALDMMSGAMLAASPFVLADEDERTGTMIALLMGLGAYEIAAALLTQTQPSLPADQTISPVPEMLDRIRTVGQQAVPTH